MTSKNRMDTSKCVVKKKKILSENNQQMDETRSKHFYSCINYVHLNNLRCYR